MDGFEISSKTLNRKNIAQKKMQERAKRELDAIVKSWRDCSDLATESRSEKNVSFQELHVSYPSGKEEIEGSDCSSLQYFNENETKQEKLLNFKGKNDPPLSTTGQVQNTDELATELCHKVSDILKNREYPSNARLENDRDLSTEKIVKDSKEPDVQDLTVKCVDNGTQIVLTSSIEKTISSVVTSDSDVQHFSDDTSKSHDNTKQKKYSCHLCQKHYKTSSHLSRHIKTAHGNRKEQDHQCNICNTSFTRFESLIRHLKIHEKRNGANKLSIQGPYKCPKCPKRYQQPYNVTRHLLTHTGEKPFKCTECNKTFTQYTGLSRHLVLHLGNRDFKCKKCGKAFARLFVLNRHMLTHTDDKPYKCTVCSKSFIRASQLSCHMHSHKK